MTTPRTEEIAREAVALCADLLRRYERTDPSVAFAMARSGLVEWKQILIWTERVLAWQDQLDHQETTP